MKVDSSGYIICACPSLWCPSFVWLWHHHLCIWALLPVIIRGLTAAALPWMLDFWNSNQTLFVETGFSRFSNIQLCCHSCCSSSVIFLNSPSRYKMIYLFLSVLIFSLLLSSYADMIFETCALDTPNSLTALWQILYPNAHQWSVFFENQTSCQFMILWCRLSLNTITNPLTWALQNVNKWKENIHCYQQMFLQYSVSIILSTHRCSFNIVNANKFCSPIS
jgi:hypothetical protein